MTAGAGTAGQAAAGTIKRDPLLHLRLNTYQPLLRSTFTLEHPHGPIAARLVEVTEERARGRRETRPRETFSLIFEAKRGEPLPQGTYSLEHPSLGRFSLFLVPVGRGAKGFFLEAIVNRWRDGRH